MQKNAVWGIRDAALVILSIICLIIGTNIFLLLINARQYFETAPHRSLITLALFIIQESLFLAPLYFFVMKRYGATLSDLGMRSIGWRSTALWVLKGFGVVFIFNIIFFGIMSQVGELPGFAVQESHIPLFGSSALDIAVAVLVLVIIAPVIEEILFRGFLLKAFLTKFQPWLASLLTAGFFAVIHFEFQSIAVILFLAFVLNWMYMRSGSIIPGIVFHMINNALAFAMEFFVFYQ